MSLCVTVGSIIPGACLRRGGRFGGPRARACAVKSTRRARFLPFPGSVREVRSSLATIF